MRTDVKLGLAVGSILFSVVLVYVLFFTSGGKPKPTPNAPGNEVAVKAPADAPAPAAPAVTPANPVTPAAPEPVVSITPTTMPSSPAGPVASSLNILPPPVSPMPAPAPSAGASEVASATPAAGGVRNWQTLLDAGAGSADLVARSETPMVGGVRGYSSGAPATPITPVVDPAVATVTPPTEAAPATQPAMARHVIKPGETLWSIANDAYGNASYHSAIAKANPKINPNRLKAGDTLLLPAKNVVAPVAAVVAVAPATQPVDPAKQYRVKANDNLNTICKRLYGNTARVAQLYELNKDKIGPNSSRLRLGMVLQLPEAPTVPTVSTTPTVQLNSTTSAGNPIAGTIH